MPASDLSLPEQLLLLSLNDKSGAFEGGCVPYYGLNAAALAELLALGRIALAEDHVEVGDGTPTGDELLDAALSRLAQAGPPQRITHWVRDLYPDRKLPVETLTARLARRGILKVEEGRVLWVFHRTTYPTADPHPEQRLRQGIHAALTDADGPPSQTSVLIAILHGCQALGLVFSREELQQYGDRIGAICEGDETGRVIGKAVADVLDEDAAMIAATTIITSSS